FLVFAAVYAATISCFSGEPRVPVACSAHGRSAPDLKRTVGLFATMFVLHADLSGDPSFSDFLAKLRETYQVCRANRNIALEELTLERKLAREPFFGHLISYHPASFAVSSFAGMPAAMELISLKHVYNELELHVRELADEFVLQLRFDEAAMDAGFVRLVLVSF